MSFGDLAMDPSSACASTAYPPDSLFHDRYPPIASPFLRSDFFGTPRSSLSDASPQPYHPSRGASVFQSASYPRYSSRERRFEADRSPTPQIRLSMRPSSERLERLERSDVPDVSEAPDVPEISEMPDRTDRSERSERSERIARSTRSERSDRSDRPDRPDRSDRSDHSDRLDRSWRMSSEKPRSRKHRKATKEDGSAEREAEPPSLASLRREIEANRGDLLSMALQQNGCR